MTSSSPGDDSFSHLPKINARRDFERRKPAPGSLNPQRSKVLQIPLILSRERNRKSPAATRSKSSPLLCRLSLDAHKATAKGILFIDFRSHIRIPSLVHSRFKHLAKFSMFSSFCTSGASMLACQVGIS